MYYKKFLSSFAGQSNILTIPRVFVQLLDGDLVAALLLNQICFWSGVKKGGYFYKSYKDWKGEVGLTQYQVARAANLLRELGVISVKRKRANGAPTLHYRCEFDCLEGLIIKMLDNQETLQSDYQETQQSDYQETLQSDYQETQQSLTVNNTVNNTVNIPKPGVAEYKPLFDDSAEGRMRTRIAESVRNGRVVYEGIVENVTRYLKINPNMNTKTGREFVAFIKARPTTETVKAFSEWWFTNDWRGKQGQPPTLDQVMLLWPACFSSLAETQITEAERESMIRATRLGFAAGD